MSPQPQSAWDQDDGRSRRRKRKLWKHAILSSLLTLSGIATFVWGNWVAKNPRSGERLDGDLVVILGIPIVALILLGLIWLGTVLFRLATFDIHADGAKPHRHKPRYHHGVKTQA